MTQTEIEEYITQFPIYQYAFVKPEDIEFNDRVRQICKKECSRYGASWSCPPAVGTVEVCKERCMNYDHVLFFSSIAEVDNIMENGSRRTALVRYTAAGSGQAMCRTENAAGIQRQET